MTPFFDTRDVGRIKLANSILNYPHEFCLRDENLAWILKDCGTDEGLIRLANTLREAQVALAKHLPLRGSSMLWAQRDRWVKRLAPTTVQRKHNLPDEVIQDLGYSLDMMIIEEMLATIPTSGAGSPKEEAVKAAFICTWLAQNLAMIALGLAKAELNDDDSLQVTSASTTARMHLRRLWFSSAFEQMSLRFASAQIHAYAALAAGTPRLVGDIQKAFGHAVSVFPQHWRLPADEGPVAALVVTHLMPLMKLVAHAMHAASKPGTKRPLLAKDAHRLGFGEVYDSVLIDQAGRPTIDRVFELSGGGLVLGTRQLAPGLLAIAESIASKQLGKDWHNNALSAVQKKYLISRLNQIAHVEVIDIGIEMHDTEDEVAVDVDFFVRDTRKGTLYAAQLKHLEFSDKGGMRAWTHRIRNREKGLGKGIAQLEAITSLARSDGKVRTKLLDSGIKPNELESLVPLVLHNLGLLDCLAFQEGILLYDQHTFVNVLADRPANMTYAVNGHIGSASFLGQGKQCTPINPDLVIDAYLSDPKFKDLEHFDAVSDVTRHLHVGTSMIASQGLGL